MILFFKIFALLPVFLLQFNNGMHAAFPAILTPQLRDECSEINIGTDEESWIGKSKYFILYL